MGKLRVTIEHGHDNSGYKLIAWMIAGGLFILAINAHTFMPVVGAGIVIAAYWLCGLATAIALILTAVKVYKEIRDRPVYERIRRDIEDDLATRPMTKPFRAIKNPEPTAPLKVQSTRGPQITPQKSHQLDQR